MMKSIVNFSEDRLAHLEPELELFEVDDIGDDDNDLLHQSQTVDV